jgi:hypothetical protein
MAIGTGLAILGGALIGGVASSKAAKAQKKGAQAAATEQQRQYDLTRQDQAPYREAGVGALNKLQDPLANFQASPDYAFRRSEGNRGITQNFGAGGGAFSGNALKALSEYNSNLASGEYGNWWNRQAGLAGVGQNATNAVGQFGANAANNISNSMMAQGDARASGIMGVGNSLAGSINSGLNAYATRNVGYGGQYGWGNMRTPPIQADPSGGGVWGIGGYGNSLYGRPV